MVLPEHTEGLGPSVIVGLGLIVTVIGCEELEQVDPVFVTVNVAL